MAHILDLLRGYLIHYGYWAVATALLLENAGLPMPGETVLLLASFLAYSQHELRVPYLIAIGICAAALGDNLGFAIGHYGGRPLLERYERVLHVPRHALEKGEKLFRRYGAATIFFARFIFGLRVIAGPLAGVLRMPWREFVVYNLLGAALWVSLIVTVGYLFGRHWDLLLRYMDRADIALTAVAVLVVVLLWWHKRRQNDSSGAG
jgi:membrane protein DedA with SNARE-associated domain